MVVFIVASEDDGLEISREHPNDASSYPATSLRRIIVKLTPMSGTEYQDDFKSFNYLA